MLAEGFRSPFLRIGVQHLSVRTIGVRPMPITTTPNVEQYFRYTYFDGEGRVTIGGVVAKSAAEAEANARARCGYGETFGELIG